MATTISTQDIVDAKRDIDDIGKAVNEKVIVSPRYGEDFKSLPMIADEAQATIGEWESAIALITQEGGVPALAVSDASGKTQQEINDLTGAPYRVKFGGYDIGERVVLENGDIVKSTIAGNTVNPNLDMTGWLPSANFGFQFDSSLNSKRTVKLDSVDALKAWPFLFDNMIAHTESYYAGLNKGGAKYEWDSSSIATANNMTVIQSNLTSTGRWVLKDQLNSHNAGCYANGVADDTLRLNAIADLALPYVVLIKSGTYAVNAVTGGFMPKSGNRFYCEDGVVFKVIPNSANSYFAIKVAEGVTGVKVLGKITVKCDRYEHTGTTGEWGHGIGVISTNDVEFGDVTVEDAWGDGIYIGSTTTTALAPVNTKFGRVVVKNSRRQGLSVITCDGLTIDYLEASNINGTDPQCGVDFEPNAPSQSIKGVRIGELVTSECVNQGLIFGLSQINGGVVEIQIDKYTSNKDLMGAYFLRHPVSAKGYIKFGQIVTKNSKAGSFLLNSWDAYNGIAISVDNMTIINPNTDNLLSTSTGGLAVTVRTIGSFTKPIGNLRIGELDVIRDGTITTYQNTHDIYINLEHENALVENCSLPINNPARVYGLAALDVNKNNIKGMNRNFAITPEALNMLIIASTYRWMSIQSGTARHTTVFETSARTLNTVEYSVDDFYDQRTTPATGAISVTFPSTTNEGYTVYTLTAVNRKLGSNLRFKAVNGVWVITSKVGNWTAT